MASSEADNTNENARTVQQIPRASRHMLKQPSFWRH